MNEIRSMTTLSTDRDSLLALDALLRIRDCMQRDDALLAGNMNGMIPPGAFPQVGALGGFSLPMGAGMALRQSTGPMYPSSHVAALHAAAAASASNSQMYRSAPPSFGIGSNESSQLPSMLPARFGGRNKTPESLTNASEERSTADPPSSKAAVRIEKVEAALKSKPQRGRKRDNLNVMERMELTRTRNREHAKSTRIRKKQRYQDLIDCEQKLQDVATAEELASQRVQSMNNVLSIREGMLLQFLGCSGGLESDGSKSKDCTKRTQGGEKVEYTSLLREVVDNMADFRADIDNTASSEDNKDTSVLTKMQTWDQAVASRVQGALGMDAARVLAYKVVGEAGGIGLSQDGTGFARVSLVSNSDQGCVLILSGILTVKFAPDSSRLQYMRWTTVEEGLLAASKPSRMQDDSSERLGQQMVYPSMVSLENHHKNSETYD